ncbi:MAG: ATP-binding cassette domain-containing protein [Nitrosomonas sp. PRO4]|nr:ATP-binding cassette domain-containing protein [Nitrosomonas sp. PRO4]
MTQLLSYLPVFRRLIPHRELLLLALIAMFFVAAVIAFLPLLAKLVLESVFIQKDLTSLHTAVISIILLLVVRGVASYASSYTIHKAIGQLSIDLRNETFEKLLALPVIHYLRLSKHEIEKLIAQISQVTHNLVNNFSNLCQDCLIIFGLMICILYLNQEVFLLLLLIPPLLILIDQITHNQSSNSNAENPPASAGLVEHIVQSIKNYREIRANGGQACESKLLEKKGDAIYQAEMQQASVKAIIIPLGDGITALIIIAIFYFIAQQTFNNILNLDTVGALLAAILLLVNPFRRIMNVPKQLQRDQVSVKAILSFLNQESERDTGTQTIDRIHGKLTFEQVHFYSHNLRKSVLNHIDIVIEPCQAIAFISYTSAQKNALIDLILRLQQPSHGKIFLDDYALTDIPVDKLRANIAIVTKDSVLLDDSIAGNIAYGSMRCSNEANITIAAQNSKATEFIREMPEGLQTKITQSSTAFTQKQCQQIAIARALLKNPPILILDELTDDPEFDKLLPSLEKLLQNRTTLIFTHRIPQPVKIDRILALDNGGITENIKSHY